MLEGKNREAMKIAAQLMVENGLGDWHLEIKNLTSTHAQTTHKTKLITYSSRFITVATEEHFIGVTYHEIAHALVGGRHGHDYTFKAKYHELTGDYKYAGYGSQANTKHYLTICDACGSIGTTNNNYRKRWCSLCWRKNRKMEVVRVEPNPLTLVPWEKSSVSKLQTA